MSQANPYASPSTETADERSKLPGWRTLFASVAAVALTTFGGCWVGIGAGSVAGSIAPEVYAPPEREYAALPNAQIIGMGQGLGGGCVTGLILVALFYWYRSRVRRKLETESPAAAATVSIAPSEAGPSQRPPAEDPRPLV